MRVEKIMRKDVLALRVEEAIDAAWRRMRDHRIEALPVTGPAGHLVGHLTEKDLLARLAPRRSTGWWATIWATTDQLAADYMKTVGVTVGDIMTTTPLVVVAPDATIEEAAALMRKHDIGALPVVADEVCLGIVTRAEVLDHLSWPTAALPRPRNDVELELAMREGIERELWASKHPVTVMARDGVVRLTGVVTSPVERAALLAMARSLAGSADIEDRLLVLPRTAPVI